MDMDDDDEFGDLYTDVLRPLSSIPSSSISNPPPSDPLSFTAAGDRISAVNPNSDQSIDALAPTTQEGKGDDWLPENWNEDDGDDGVPVANFNAKMEPRVLEEGNGEGISGSGGDGGKIGADVGFRVSSEEEKIETGDLDHETVIPGLYTVPLPSNGGIRVSNSEDWDSDSEDDLQIVLNDNTHGPMGGGRIGNEDEDDDDGEEDLVIVTDEDQQLHHHQVMEEQDWGEVELQTGADGEKKEGSEAAKANGAVGSIGGGPRIGYSSHGFHPQHHSMFKYVRPGAPANQVGPHSQIRPPSSVGPNGGRGRGDWRPPGIRGIPGAPKNFHSGYGTGWANSSRGFGGGLDFTLPSHKTIFDVDIESFEEKPWKYPGADISDYFNFGLDEDNWKVYCKQLDQLRLESTMQSKIRVYEGGRAEQDYDPDLPPELAAATGQHDISVDNMHRSKIDNGQSDMSVQGSGIPSIRPPFPPGRAIQVETGYGERLPSIDTRPPRIRDTDAIIEIVLQDSMEDSTIYNAAEQPEKDIQGKQLKDVHDAEGDRNSESEYFDHLPQTFNGHRREMGSRTIPYASEGDGKVHFSPESPHRHHTNSRIKSPLNPAGSFGSHRGGRLTEGASRGRHSSTSGDHSNDTIPTRNAQGNKYHSDQKENLGKRVEGSQTPEPSNPNARELSLDERHDEHDDMIALGEDSIEIERDETSDLRISGDTIGGDHSKMQKLSSRVEQTAVPNGDDDEDDQRTTNSDNSRAKSGNSNRKRRGSGDVRRHHEEEEPAFRRKDDCGEEGRHEMEKKRLGFKGQEAMYHSYPHRDWESNPGHPVRGRTEVFERPRETDSSFWQRREDNFYGRRIVDDEIGSRVRSKVRMNDSIDRDKNAHSKKMLEDGNWRGHSRESGPRLREKDDTSTRRELLDDHQVKRRKGEEQSRRERTSREDSFYSYRPKEESSRRKRERDDNTDHRRREDISRVRDKAEDHHSSKHKEDKQRLKQPHADPLPHKEREEGRGGVGSGRSMEEKTFGGSGRNKIDSKILVSDKEYQHRERRQHNEQSKRGREDVHAREKHQNNQEGSSKHDRLSIHSDRPSSTPDNQQTSKEREREGTRKSKDNESSRENPVGIGQRKHDDRGSYHNEKVSSKGTSEREGKNASLSKNVNHQLHSHVKQVEGPASDDDGQLGSKRGRSKLERWTSHKERDYSAANNNRSSSSSSRVKEVNDTSNNNIVPIDELPKTESLDVSDSDPKGADGDERDQQLDTMAKLKRRSERFKLPMPGEKDTTLSKRAENDALPAQNEAPADTEVKPERPPRKRRWTSS